MDPALPIPILELIISLEGARRVLASVIQGVNDAKASVRARLLAQTVNVALPAAANTSTTNLRGRKINIAVNRIGLVPAKGSLPDDSIELNLSDPGSAVTERWRTMTRMEFADQVCRPLIIQTIRASQKTLENIDSPGALSMRIEDAGIALEQIFDSNDHLSCFYAILCVIVCDLLPRDLLGPPALIWAAIGAWEGGEESLVADMERVLGGTILPNQTLPTLLEVAIRWMGRVTTGVHQWHATGCPHDPPQIQM